MTDKNGAWRRLSDEEASALRALLPDQTLHPAHEVAAYVELSTRIERLRAESASLESDLTAARAAATEAGYRAGLDRAAADIATIGAELREQVAALRTRASLVALAAAEAVLHAEVATSPALMLERINALLAASPQRPTRIRLCPPIHAALAPHAGELPVLLVPDPSLAPADAIFELATGQIDARIQLALQLIRPHVDAELAAPSERTNG
jgi:flagellar biosynthesis/type III secretory pathway protein FliH